MPPQTDEIEEWQIKLYKLGDPAGPPSAHWGVISAGTASEVLYQLSKEQRLEKQYAAEAGDSIDRRKTYFNPIGPIAKMRKKGSSPRSPAQSERSSSKSHLGMSSPLATNSSAQLQQVSSLPAIGKTASRDKPLAHADSEEYGQHGQLRRKAV